MKTVRLRYTRHKTDISEMFIFGFFWLAAFGAAYMILKTAGLSADIPAEVPHSGSSTRSCGCL